MTEKPDEHRAWKDVNAYREWRRALGDDDTLQDIAIASSRKPYSVDIRYVAICIAEKGNNGYNCFPEPKTIADLIPCSEKTVKTCRTKLIELGWFTVTGRNGGRNRRSLVLDIAIPKAENVESERALPTAGSRAASAIAGEHAGGYHAA